MKESYENMRLKEIREINKHIQVTTSKLLGVARGTYASWEIEQDIIPIKRLNDFCKLYDISIDYAMNLTDIIKYPNSKPEIDINKSKIRLRAVRKEHKHTQDYLGKKLDIDRSLLSKYETGENIISTIFLTEYAKMYHISCDYLLGKIDEKIELKVKLKN